MGERSNGAGREGRVGEREGEGRGEGKSLTYNDRILDTPLCYTLFVWKTSCREVLNVQMGSSWEKKRTTEFSKIFIILKIFIIRTRNQIFNLDVRWRLLPRIVYDDTERTMGCRFVKYFVNVCKMSYRHLKFTFKKQTLTAFLLEILWMYIPLIV